MTYHNPTGLHGLLWEQIYFFIALTLLSLLGVHQLSNSFQQITSKLISDWHESLMRLSKHYRVLML
jgi:hypothetical protein